MLRTTACRASIPAPTTISPSPLNFASCWRGCAPSCGVPANCGRTGLPSRTWFWILAAQTAARGGRQIALTTKEYALLEYLARHAGRVVGREEISEHVWDETFDPFTNTIEVYVNRLRRKIDAHPAKPLIHTRRGAGYMLGDAAPGGVAAASEAAAPGEKAKAGQLNPGANPAAICAQQGRSMFDSVRVRLTLWYTGVLALVLVCLAVGTYYLVARTTDRRTFISLAEISQGFLTTLQSEYKDQLNEKAPDPLRAAAEESVQEFRLRDHRFAVLDSVRQRAGGKPGAACATPARPKGCATRNPRRRAAQSSRGHRRSAALNCKILRWDASIFARASCKLK